MCTAISVNGFFGRNLDYEQDFGEQVMIMPRNFPFSFSNGKTLDTHCALIGMGIVEKGIPLFFDATNEWGLSMAGLNFPHNAVYHEEGKDESVASFELIPYILLQCKSLEEARELLLHIYVSDRAFSKDLHPTPLHFMVSDGVESLTVEPVAEGLCVYHNPVGVLTNNPPFLMQMNDLQRYMGLSEKTPQNRFFKDLVLKAESRGMGALGLPGDWSSASRFVRACFVREHSCFKGNSQEQVEQFFHILDAVAQPFGCVEVTEGMYEKTRYSSCCDVTRGIYYYTTYENRQITAVRMQDADLTGDALTLYPLVKTPQIALAKPNYRD
jgi:choloylglycine hydrolase